MSRLEFLERLCALIPRPGVNQTLYHGILAAHASGRSEVVPVHPPRTRTMTTGFKLIRVEGASTSSRWWSWVELLARVFSVDAFQCPRCSCRFELRAIVIGAPATSRILDGLARAEARGLGEEP